jgi:hypothetical protein
LRIDQDPSGKLYVFYGLYGGADGSSRARVSNGLGISKDFHAGMVKPVYGLKIVQCLPGSRGLSGGFQWPATLRSHDHEVFIGFQFKRSPVLSSITK